MNANDYKPPATFPESRERQIILLLCCIAALHVFVFSAAFPPINNVDEQQHFDLVVKYSHGHLPRELEPTSAEAMDYVAIYGSQEFLWPPITFPGGKFPPPLWTQPMEKVAPIIKAREAAWKSVNRESSQPPLYYALAGGWWKVGQWLGFGEGRLFYWLRFLNILLVVSLIYLTYLTARRIFPEDLFLRLGAPALLAFLPQSAFYSINNDMLTPLTFGVAFVCLVCFWQADAPSPLRGAAVGLALAAAWLAKASILPLLVVSVVFIALKIRRLAQSGKLRMSLPALTAMMLCALMPAAAWAAYCKVYFGDFTGSAAKIQSLGWTLRPFAEWRHHPIFSLHGVWTYLLGQLSTFWQGEFLWYGQPMTLPSLDVFYTLLSCCLLVLALAALLRNRATMPDIQRAALTLAIFCFGAALGFYAFTSIIYDFGNCFNPSRDFPYFHAGRMMLGALVPFLLLFVFGLDRLPGCLGGKSKFLVLGGLILFMLANEITTDWPVFSSQYNWFHM